MDTAISKHTIFIIFLILISIIVYSNTFKNSFIWDDKVIVSKGEYISNPKNIPSLFTPRYWRQFYLMLSREHNQEEKVNFRPILMASFAFDYSLWKLNPFGYHLTSLFLHIINVILIYFFILNIVALQTRHGRLFNLAFLSALFFAVHPIHTESITWIKNRSDPLALIFFILSFILFTKFRLQDRLKSRIVFYSASLLCFILALFSKAMAITLPFILVLYVICFVPKEEYKGFITKTLPFWGLAILYIIFKIIILGTVGSGKNLVVKISLYPKILTVIKTIGYYVKLLVFPFNLNAERSFSIPGSFFEPAVLFSALLLVVLTVIVIKAFRHSRLVLFFLFWIFLTLLPISNIIFLVSRPIAEQRLYIPSVGLCVLLAIGVQALSSLDLRFFPQRIARRSTIVLIFTVVSFYSYTVMQRNLDWRDSVTFWTKTVEASPNSHRAYNNLGTAYYNTGLYEDALNSYQNALEVDSGYAWTYNNLGVTYRDMGKKTNEAINSFRKAIQIKPDYAEAYNNLGGVLYEDLDQVSEASELYKKAVELEPDYAEAYYNLGLMYDLLVDYETAIGYYKKSIKLDPELGIAAYNNLGYIYLERNNFTEAIGLLKKALSIDPESAETLDTLGWAYYRKGDLDEAFGYLKKAASLLPDNAEIKGHLKAVYSEKGIEEGE